MTTSSSEASPNQTRPSTQSVHDTNILLLPGGTASCVIASRLSQDPNVSVLVLCKGTVADSYFFRIPLAGQAEGGECLQPTAVNSEPVPECNNRTPRVPTSQALGGATRVNGLMLTRGAPGCFEKWKEMGNDRWGWESVEPYFRKIENAHCHPGAKHRGHDGEFPWGGRANEYATTVSMSLLILRPRSALCSSTAIPIPDRQVVCLLPATPSLSLPFPYPFPTFLQPPLSYSVTRLPNGPLTIRSIHKAAPKVGLPVIKDLNDAAAPVQGIYDIDTMITNAGFRCDAYTSYLPKALALDRKSRLTICTGALASRLSLEGGVAKGVHVIDHLKKKGSKEYFVRARREVIVACGVLGSPHLLLLRCVPRQRPRNGPLFQRDSD